MSVGNQKARHMVSGAAFVFTSLFVLNQVASRTHIPFVSQVRNAVLGR